MPVIIRSVSPTGVDKKRTYPGQPYLTGFGSRTEACRTWLIGLSWLPDPPLCLHEISSSGGDREPVHQDAAQMAKICRDVEPGMTPGYLAGFGRYPRGVSRPGVCACPRMPDGGKLFETHIATSCMRIRNQFNSWNQQIWSHLSFC